MRVSSLLPRTDRKAVFQRCAEKQVILKEDGLDTPEPEPATISVPVTVGANPPLELSIGPW